MHLWACNTSHNFTSLKSKRKKLVRQSSSLLQEVAENKLKEIDGEREAINDRVHVTP